MSKNNTVLNFLKRNVYYLIIGIALIVTAIVIMAVVLGKNNSVAEKPKPIIQSSEEPTKNTESESETTIAEQEPESESKPDETKPTDTKIVFTLPVQNASIIKDFTSSTVVFNKTLGVYTGHMGMDFAAAEGTAVVCAYDGKIESVVTSYLEGTTVTVNHGNGLKSVYNSIEAEENLYEGKSVKAGEVIGKVSDNNKQEYKDGPHLHFEVLQDGERIDPETYLFVSEK